MSEYYDWNPEEFPVSTPLRKWRVAGTIKELFSEYRYHLLGGVMGLGIWAFFNNLDHINGSSSIPVVVECTANPGVDNDKEAIADIPWSLSMQIENRMAEEGLDVDESSCRIIKPNENKQYILTMQPGEQTHTFDAGSYTVVVTSPITEQS